MALHKANIQFRDGYNMLVKEGMTAKPQPPVKNGRLPLGDILTATSVFQPRTGNGSVAWSEGHTASLATALRSSTTRELDPITVWWSGETWRVVDGHHRLDAYRQVSNPSQKAKGKKQRVIPISTVPVELFTGTINQAIAYAAEANSKDKLSMTKTDKLETAWRMTVLGGFSKAEVARATTIAETTVENMRKALKELEARNRAEAERRRGAVLFDIQAMTWTDTKRALLGEREIDDKWMDKQALEWARKLSEALRDKMAKNPTLTLRAIKVYSKNLPKSLVEAFLADMGTVEPVEDGEPGEWLVVETKDAVEASEVGGDSDGPGRF